MGGGGVFYMAHQCDKIKFWQPALSFSLFLAGFLKVPKVFEIIRNSKKNYIRNFYNLKYENWPIIEISLR